MEITCQKWVEVLDYKDRENDLANSNKDTLIYKLYIKNTNRQCIIEYQNFNVKISFLI